ncbi:peroxiredoxin family protein [candidate division KSB1 bacterium]|nr:peroxiredoxin family protein [candidate division KSB1 bacterium]
MKSALKNLLKWLGLSLLAFGFNSHCGKMPGDAPPPATGSIEITAHVDSTRVDSMQVSLDGVALGLHINPFLIPDVVAGRHQVVVTKADPFSPIGFESIPQLVSVFAQETTRVLLALSKLAPNFTLRNLKNESVTLAQYRGKVVLLMFFTHT